MIQKQKDYETGKSAVVFKKIFWFCQSNLLQKSKKEIMTLVEVPSPKQVLNYKVTF